MKLSNELKRMKQSLVDNNPEAFPLANLRHPLIDALIPFYHAKTSDQRGKILDSLNNLWQQRNNPNGKRRTSGGRWRDTE